MVRRKKGRRAKVAGRCVITPGKFQPLGEGHGGHAPGPTIGTSSFRLLLNQPQSVSGRWFVAMVHPTLMAWRDD
jgi:hypothetical protein